MVQQQQEPDWKTVAQAAMQQRDEANRNLCNLQIEMAVMADRLKKYEEDSAPDTGADPAVIPAKKANSAARV